MFKQTILLIPVCFLALIFNGCSVKTYKMTKERVDQDLSAGNRGFLTGKPEGLGAVQRKATREIQVLEIEFPRSRSRLQVGPTPGSDITVEEGTKARVVSIPVDSTPEGKVAAAITAKPAVRTVIKKYTIQKGDSLQSISQRFYGTTKHWKKILDNNQDVLKRPDRIYPGQVIEIPVEEGAGIK